MNVTSIKFPQYRKYLNGKSYFKISSKNLFEEIKVMSKGKYHKYTIEAKILPDRNFILDMLHNYEQHWLKIEAAEYDSINGIISE